MNQREPDGPQAEKIARKYHRHVIETTITGTFAPDYHDVYDCGCAKMDEREWKKACAFGLLNCDNKKLIGSTRTLAEAVAIAKRHNPNPAPPQPLFEDEDDIDTELDD